MTIYFVLWMMVGNMWGPVGTHLTLGACDRDAVQVSRALRDDSVMLVCLPSNMVPPGSGWKA